MKKTENEINIFDKENNDEIIDGNNEIIKKESIENDLIPNNNENKSIKEDLKNIKKIEIKKFNNEYLSKQTQNKLTTFKINNNEKQILLHKNYSDINLINNKNYQNNKENYLIPNINNKVEGKKTIGNFINIKKINVNYRNNALKLPKKNNINPYKNFEDIRLKYALVPKKFNNFNNLNNNKFNKPIKNIFNINNH
jgi:hypothetical protein